MMNETRAWLASEASEAHAQRLVRIEDAYQLLMNAKIGVVAPAYRAPFDPEGLYSDDRDVRITAERAERENDLAAELRHELNILADRLDGAKRIARDLAALSRKRYSDLIEQSA